jgi:hypothetical protein
LIWRISFSHSARNKVKSQEISPNHYHYNTTPATKENATASGINASATVKPDSISSFIFIRF